MKPFLVVPKRTMDYKEAEEFLNKPQEPEPYPVEDFATLAEAEEYASLCRLAGYTAVIQDPKEFYEERARQMMQQGVVVIRELDE